MNRYCQSHAKATAAGLQCPPAAVARVAYRVAYHIAYVAESDRIVESGGKPLSLQTSKSL